MNRLLPAAALSATLLAFSAGCQTPGLPDNRSGVTEYREGRMPQAVSEFTEAIELNTSYRYARNNRGLTHFLLGNHNDALKDLQVAIDRESGYAHARNNRAALWMDRADDERALVDLDIAIREKEDYKEGYFNRARLFLATEELDRALEAADRAVEIHEDENKKNDSDEPWAAAYFLRAMIRTQLLDHAGAAQDFEQAAEQQEMFAQVTELPYPPMLRPGHLAQ
jgi:tetratricopeptide (TPR) repeat protein